MCMLTGYAHRDLGEPNAAMGAACTGQCPNDVKSASQSETVLVPRTGSPVKHNMQNPSGPATRVHAHHRNKTRWASPPQVAQSIDGHRSTLNPKYTSQACDGKTCHPAQTRQSNDTPACRPPPKTNRPPRTVQ